MPREAGDAAGPWRKPIPTCLPRPAHRPLVAGLTLALGLACGGLGTARSFVTGPTTLAEVRALADDGMVVREERFDPQFQDDCSRSPYCFLLLPVEPLTPDVVHVTVDDPKGARVWDGFYATSGDLISAVSQVPGGQERIRRLQNAELGEPWLVVTHTADGSGDWSPAALDDRIGDAYLPALTATSSADRRVALVKEVLAQTPHSAAPVITWLIENGTDDDLAPLLLPPRGLDRPDAEVLRQLEPLRREVALAPRGLRTAAASLCVNPTPAVRRAVIEGVCAFDAHWEEALATWEECLEPNCRGVCPAPEGTAALVAACPEGAGRGLVAVVVGVPVEADDLLAALRSSSRSSGWTAGHMEFAAPAEVAAVDAYLASGDDVSRSLEQAITLRGPESLKTRLREGMAAQENR